MTERTLSVHEAQLAVGLLPALRGRVFHVTCGSNRNAIDESGGILPNVDYSRSSPFGFSRNGFFRLRGCVSLFDYREVAEAC